MQQTGLSTLVMCEFVSKCGGRVEGSLFVWVMYSTHSTCVCVCVAGRGGLPGVCFGKDNFFHETEVG